MDVSEAQATNSPLISVVIPLHNESENVPVVFAAVKQTLDQLAHAFEVVFVNDGSTDTTEAAVKKLQKSHPQIRFIQLARNFGKEIALTAGLHHAKGDAVIMLDADMQHPPHLMPEFIAKWKAGADVVVGVRATHGKKSPLKKLTSHSFYALINKVSDVTITPHATDFRLLDRAVIDQFVQFTERSRIVRGLIDWLGFTREYVYFDAADRHTGEASYTLGKLFKLAMDSFVSMSLLPLRISGYIGFVIVLFSGPLGFVMFLDTYFLGNRFSFTGPASVGVLVLFLIGVTLVNLGLMGLYIANIHNEVINRPLYVLKTERGR